MKPMTRTIDLIGKINEKTVEKINRKIGLKKCDERIIYFYSTNSHYDYRIKHGDVPMLKIGETKLQKVDVRIKQQDGTSNPEPLVCKGAYKVIFSDKEFHIFLEERGYVRTRVDADREWFYITVEDALRELEIYKGRKSVSRLIKQFYNPRTFQTEVSEKVVSRYDGKTIIIPLNLCPRFGKDLTHLDIFQRLFNKFGIRVMVIASYWLGANESLKKTITKGGWDISSDIEIIPPDYDKFIDAIENDKRVLIDVSLHVDSNKVDSRLINALEQEDALIVVDEADHGAWTPISKSVLNQYIDAGNNLVTFSTGTNIDRAVIGAKRKVQEVINVSYVDLLERKKQGDATYQDLVEITCYNLDATQAFIDKHNSLPPEDRLNMSKLFGARGSHAQRNFINQVLNDEERGEDVFGIYASHWVLPEHPALMVWIPTTKKDANNLTNLIKSMCPTYNVIALHGDEYTNRVAEEYVKKSIEEAKKNGKERTVIVSCGMGARSFSIPNIIACVDCNDGGSFGPAAQRASRCLTPGCDKQMGLFINYTFNPNRSSTFEAALLSESIRKNLSNTNAAVRRVYGLINILKDRNTFMTETDFVDYITCSENLVNMASATVDVDIMLQDEILKEIINAVKKYQKTGKKWKGDAWVSKLEKAKTYMDASNRSETSNSSNESLKKHFRAKIHSIIQKVGNLSYLAPKSTSFVDALQVVANDSSKNLEYANLVGIGADDVLNYIVPYIEDQTYINLIVKRNSTLGTYDKFQCVQHEHPSNLFVDAYDTLSKNNVIIYSAKEPCQGVINDLEQFSKTHKVIIHTCQPGYDDYYQKLGYELTDLNNLDKNMNFYAIGNQPFASSNGGGSLRGSTSNPLWLQGIKKLLEIVPEGGYLNQITPTNFIDGGDSFTKLVLGPERQYDLIKVDFSVDQHFKVGIPMCRWILRKTLTKGHQVNVNGNRKVDADTTFKIYDNPQVHEILNRIFSSNGPKLNFDSSNRYDYANVERYLKKNGLPIEWAKELELTKTETHQYPVNINGKIKYSRVKWVNNGTWRLFVAKMQNPLIVELNQEWEADGSTFTMSFSDEKNARLTQSYMMNPIYMWIIEQTRVSGRLNGTTLSKFPNEPIENVLTSDQISYIQSQIVPNEK